MKKEISDKLLQLSEEEYNAYASEFSTTRTFFWRELEFLKEYVHDGGTVLDIGCGNGRLVDLFEGMPISYTGIDSSQKLITIAEKERGGKGTFIHTSALSLPFKDNSFDTVFSIAVLHHIPSLEYRMQFISEIGRVLKPGGTCVLTTWNILQWRFLKIHALHFFKKVFGLSPLDFGDVIIPFGKEKRKRFVHAMTRQGLRTLFVKNNLSPTTLKEVKRKSGFSNYLIVAKKKDFTSSKSV